MSLPALSKSIAALVLYLLGAWAMDRALGGLWTGLTVLGLALVVWGTWLSTVKGRRDFGDGLMALAAALVIGQGLVLMAAEPQLAQGSPTLGPRLILLGHVAGLVLLAAGWGVLRRHGIVPGGTPPA